MILTNISFNMSILDVTAQTNRLPLWAPELHPYPPKPSDICFGRRTMFSLIVPFYAAQRRPQNTTLTLFGL